MTNRYRKRCRNRSTSNFIREVRSARWRKIKSRAKRGSGSGLNMPLVAFDSSSRLAVSGQNNKRRTLCIAEVLTRLSSKSVKSHGQTELPDDRDKELFGVATHAFGPEHGFDVVPGHGHHQFAVGAPLFPDYLHA